MVIVGIVTNTTSFLYTRATQWNPQTLKQEHLHNLDTKIHFHSFTLGSLGLVRFPSHALAVDKQLLESL